METDSGWAKTENDIWLPTPDGYLAMQLQFDTNHQFNWDCQDLDEAMTILANFRVSSEPYMTLREPYFGQLNILTRHAVEHILWVRPIWIDHEEIKANAVIAKQQNDLAKAGIVTGVVQGKKRNGR